MAFTQKLGLHQSDSGADLSEYQDQQEVKSIQSLFESYNKSLGVTDETLAKSEIQDVHSKNKTSIGFDLNLDEIRNENIFTENISFIKKNENISKEIKSSFLKKENISFIENSKNNSLPEEISFPEYSKKKLIETNSKNPMKHVNCSEIIKDSTAFKTKTKAFNFDDGNIEEWDFMDELVSKSKMDLAWERYWSKCGECIIWASWFEKYANYINPEYLTDNSLKTDNTNERDQQLAEKFLEQNTCFPSEAHRNCVIGRSNFEGIFGKTTELNVTELRKHETSRGMNFSFDNTNKQDVIEKEAEDNRKRIGNQLSPEIGEGWNPLSPFSVEESSYLASNAEDEKLITKCDSINGSITRTNATSDSMTNVTKMTLTSSSCDSASTQSSSLVSSTMSSNESNVTSSSSDVGNDYTVEDNDKYWQELWKENFQEQYKKHYEEFMLKGKESMKCSDVDNLCEDKICIMPKNNKSPSHNIIESISQEVIVEKVNTSKKRMIMDSVGMLMQNLTMSCESNSSENCLSKEKCLAIDYDNEIVRHFNKTESEVLVCKIESNINSSLKNNEVREMESEEKPITLKRRYYISSISFDSFDLFFLLPSDELFYDVSFLSFI